MLKYVKMPRNLSEYTLMRGVTDFSNLKQFDLYETGYAFFNVVSTPIFMGMLGQWGEQEGSSAAIISECERAFVNILEGEFKGLDGVPGISGSSGTITNGVNEIQLINNVNMDTAIQIGMSVYERSGSPITKYIETYLTSLKDPYSKAKTYGGLIPEKITDPGAEYEVFTFLYYVTDNTCRKIEKAYLFCNAQPTEAPTATLYNITKGDINFPEISLSFTAFPIVGNEINLMAAKMLEYSLTTTNTNERFVLDSNDYQWSILGKINDSGFGTTQGDKFSSKVNSISNATIEERYQ